MTSELERATARAAAAEAERVKQERLAQLEEELREVGGEWLAERGPSKWVPGKESETLTRLQDTIRRACAAGMRERHIERVSGASRGLIRRVNSKR